MIVNYAISRSISLIKNQCYLWRRYFFLFFTLSVLLLLLEHTFMPSIINLIKVIVALLYIMVTCAFIYSLERHFGDEKERESLGEEMWAGLCFSPGYILYSIILAIGTFIGLLLFIAPGVYFWTKNFANPYYSIINSSKYLVTEAYPKKFGWPQFFDGLIMGLVYIVGLAPFGLISFYLETKKILWLRLAYLPIEVMSTIVGVAMTYFFIDYLERVRRKR
jgi:Ca2+/Na+ antiporter